MNFRDCVSIAAWRSFFCRHFFLISASTPDSLSRHLILFLMNRPVISAFQLPLDAKTLKADWIFWSELRFAGQSFLKLKFIAITISKLPKLINERIYKVTSISAFLLTCGGQILPSENWDNRHSRPLMMMTRMRWTQWKHSQIFEIKWKYHNFNEIKNYDSRNVQKCPKFLHFWRRVFLKSSKENDSNMN